MFVIKEDTEKGRSIQASIRISKNEVVAIFDGIAIDYKQTLQLGKDESFALQISREKYIYLYPPYRFFNHSCEPNCGLTPNLNLVTIREVSLGEELTYDYSTTMLEHHWKMKCNCGSTKCRKVVRDFDTLSVELQAQYLSLNIVQRFIREHVQGNETL